MFSSVQWLSRVPLFVTPWTRGFSVHRILQARILERVAITFSKMPKIHCLLFPFSVLSFFIFIFKIFTYLFSAALGLCCARAFSSCSERGLLFFVVHEPLIAVVSLVADHRL